MAANEKKQSFKEWFSSSWSNKISLIIGIATILITCILGIPQLVAQLVNAPMWEQMETYYNNHYTFIQDIEPIYPTDSSKIYFYKEAALAKRDYQNIKIVLETIKDFEQLDRKSIKDTNYTQKLEAKFGVVLTAEIISLKNLYSSRPLYTTALSLLKDAEVQKRAFTETLLSNINNSPASNLSNINADDIINQVIQEEMITYSIFDRSSKQYLKPLTEMQSILQKPNSNKERVTSMKTFLTSNANLDFLESLMAYYECKYVSCCLILHYSYENTPPFIQKLYNNLLQLTSNSVDTTNHK